MAIHDVGASEGASSSGTITVMVVDDHPLYRESILRLMRQAHDIVMVGEAVDGEQALELIRTLKPQVCLLDLHLPGLSGRQVVDAIDREGLETKVIVLTGNDESEIVYSMFEKGAHAFLLKTAGANEILDTVRAVARGETVLPPQFHSALTAEIRARHKSSRPILSERELAILEMIAKGRSAAEIADELALAPSTVKSHMSNIYTKLGVSERAAAVAKAIRIGLIS